MDKGIRLQVWRLFEQHTPARLAAVAAANGDVKAIAEANRKFRAEVTLTLCEQFNISITASAAHYNYAKHRAEKEHADWCVSLGRAEDKKGGRKKKEATSVTQIATLTRAELLGNFTSALNAARSNVQLIVAA